MSLTVPYRQHNYLGEYASDAAALSFIQANKWDSTNDGLGDPQAGVFYFNTGSGQYKIYDGSAWQTYYYRSDFKSSSAGAGDAGKPIVLDADGQVDASMINDADIDHGSIGGLADDDHTQYIRVDGTRAFTGAQSMGGFKLTNLGAPAASADAATKAYVDAFLQGIDWKDSVRLSTAAALPANTYSAGVLTADANGALTVDGVAVVVNDRILVKNEVTAKYNGLYIVSATGDESNPYVLTRTTDADSSAEVTPGIAVWVNEGTVNADSGWVLTTDAPITLDTTALSFTQFTGLGQITAGAGLTKTGNTLDVGAGTGISVSADAVAVDQSFTPTWTGTHTFSHATAPIVSAKIGAAADKQHTVPNVASDTLALTNATQTLANKTLTTPTIASFTNAQHSHQNAAGGSKLDHGLALDGLADDDHTQYHTDTRGDARYYTQSQIGSTSGGSEGAALVGTDTKADLNNAANVEVALTFLNSQKVRKFSSGAGNPNGIVTGIVGDEYVDTTNLIAYKNFTGTNTGWYVT